MVGNGRVKGQHMSVATLCACPSAVWQRWPVWKEEQTPNTERRVKRLSHFVTEKVKILGTVNLPLLRLLYSPKNVE